VFGSRDCWRGVLLQNHTILEFDIHHLGVSMCGLGPITVIGHKSVGSEQFSPSQAKYPGGDYNDKFSSARAEVSV